MPLFIGQPIDARELEHATSQWSPERFASMCDALVWAASERQYSDLPRFTGRIYAADDGIDAEWDVEIPLDEKALPTPIIGTGWNVFQYKKRDLIAQDRRRIVANLKSSLKRAVAALAKKKAKHPSRYILFVNVDLKGDQVEALKKSLLEGYDRSSEVHVEIIGAGGLTALLNDNPHLRAAYFAPLAFKTWEEANRSHRAQKLFGFDVALTGREDVLSQLRAFVGDPRVRAVVVTGPHDIGKSRLVLEATSHCPHDVVFALDPRSMTLDDYRNLVAERKNVVCIVEDPDPDRVVPLVNEMLGIEGLKVVITLRSSGDGPGASYGQDERVQSLALGPLSDEDSRRLLEATGKHLDFGVESWILDHAGGNPGILLAAASVRERLRVEAGDFAEAVGEEFERRIRSELGQEALKCAELLSTLTHVGVSGKFEAELRVICDLFGEGRQPPKVLATLEVLVQAGLAKRGGSFAEITLPILAHYLAGKLLRGRKDEVFALFGRLDEPARLRFLRQLSQVRGEEVERFWDALFDTGDPDAPFGSLKAALRPGNMHMLPFVAGAVPERTVRLLESGLIGTTREERLVISDEPRRQLMWALEQLLFRSKTSGRALRLIWLLAEAENEKWGNNATGVLSECFHPKHSQMPLPLNERLDAFREFTSEAASKEGRLVAIHAASKALGHGVYTLRHSTGVEPLDKWPVFTRRDVYDYACELVGHFVAVAETEERQVAEKALENLPRLVFELGVQGQPKEALERFQTLVEWASAEKPGLDICSLLESIELLRESLQRRIQDAGISEERKKEFQAHLATSDVLKAQLEKGSFAVRLKRWAGGWSFADRERIVVNGKENYRSELELNALAKETVERPALLTDELLSWLLSDGAPSSHTYFSYLGVEDSEGRLRARIKEIGSQTRGQIAFSAYLGGWARNNRTEAEERLRELAESNAVTGDAIIRAIANLGPSQTTLDLIKEGLLKGQITPRAAAAVLYGDWITKLSADQFLDLLKVVAADQLENAAIAIDVLGRWLHEGRPVEGGLEGFAWRCLETCPAVTSHEAYDCDKLAAKLAALDPERAFALLQNLLTQPDEKRCWNPIDRYGAHENEFWKVLRKSDHERAVRTLVSLALSDPLLDFRITWNFREVVDQEKDADLLIKLAIENERQAEVIAESISTARGGFWPIAFKIIEKYPNSEKIRCALTGGIEQAGEVHTGPYSEHLARRKQEAERSLGDPNTPAAARYWLREVLDRFEEEIAQHIIWEYDEDVISLRRYIEDRDSPERIWAMGRVLKYADLKDIRRLLTVEDIAETLPQVDLPEKKRRALERALEVWQGGS
jgi:hypothetical protein